MAKRFCNEQRNTQRYEASILSEVTCQHYAALKHKDKFDYRVMLCPPSAAMGPRLASRLRKELNLPDGLAITSSKRGRVSEFEVISTRDVVLYKSADGAGRLEVGEVWFLLAYAAVARALISTWTISSSDKASGTVNAQIEDCNVAVHPLHAIVTAVTYRRKADGYAHIIAPCLYRDAVM
jgi:hypothetical protein